MAFTLTNLYPNVTVYEASGDSVVYETGANPRATWKFIIRGADGVDDAYGALWSHLSANFSDDDGAISSYNIPLDSVSVSATESNYFFEGTAVFSYSSAEVDAAVNESGYEQPEVEELDYQYSTTGGTSHVTHSVQTLGTAGASIRDFDGGIGWNGQNFDGVDIVTPHLEFSIGVNWAKSFFTQSYRLALANATGKINSVAWHGFGAGCVLFKGVNASTKSFKRTFPDGSSLKDYYWRANYAFEAIPATSIVFNGTTLVKRGFDYVWRVCDAVEGTGGEIESAVSQVNVEQVYEEFDFAGLLLPFPV